MKNAYFCSTKYLYMSELIKIKNALISVYYKDHLGPVIRKLSELGIGLLSTGGTQEFIEKMGIKVTPVEELTNYPSILGGRVKTLHPKIFGGILGRRQLQSDLLQLEEYEIPEIDLVIVDLYPFAETVLNSRDESEIIEKIDIGGISLIRAAAKNFKDVVIISSRSQYAQLLDLLNEKKGSTALNDRKQLATQAFKISSEYDAAIFRYFSGTENPIPPGQDREESKTLRYGENPHQQGVFFGKLGELFEQLNGKELSYNNLLDIDAAIHLIADFGETTFAVLKHNNACGLASRLELRDAWKAALAGDPVSAFGGVLVTNRILDEETAKELHSLFFEVLIAPGYQEKALELLKQKPNRIILKQKTHPASAKTFRTLLNGIVEQDRDRKTESISDLKVVTLVSPGEQEMEDLVFANKIVKHSKSNAIVLAKNKQLYASGTGQSSRVDALNQAIRKASDFHFDLRGAVMASDAFFPFPDCVEIAGKAGITAIVQPGGSIKDKDSIAACNAHNIAMVVTGTRHFKH
jgi:phosphoribosylaminoimidazolecarboxamide formyltransferase/IMP cyclohydrolase